MQMNPQHLEAAMHVSVKANYEIIFLVRPGTDYSDWFCSCLFSDAVRSIPELAEAEIHSEILQEDIIVYRECVGSSAVKVTANVSVSDDLQGRHDVDALRKRLFQMFTPLVGTLKARQDCLDAYQVHPDVRIIEVVKEDAGNQLKFRKPGVFSFLKKRNSATGETK